MNPADRATRLEKQKMLRKDERGTFLPRPADNMESQEKKAQKKVREITMKDSPRMHYTKEDSYSTEAGMKMGGEVKKTGMYKLHKGEIVVPANRVSSVNKSLIKDNKKPLKK